MTRTKIAGWLVALGVGGLFSSLAAAQQLRCGLGGHGHNNGVECACEPGYRPVTQSGYRLCTRVPVRHAAPRPAASVGSCPAGMVHIPGGTFAMGDAPGRSVTVSGFCIDRTEVTVAAYRAYDASFTNASTVD